MFLLPVTYLAIIINCHTGYVQYTSGFGKMMFLMNMESEVFRGIALVWFIISMINLCRFSYRTFRTHGICKYNYDDGESLAQTEFERVKDILGMKGKITFLRNDNCAVNSPFVTGIFRRKLVLPFTGEEYDKDELAVILYHELIHFQKHDLVFKFLTIIIVALQCYNPFAYLLLRQVNYWSECDCDYRALQRLESEGIRLKQYYQTIYQLATEDKHHPYSDTFSMLFEKKNSLERRFDYMSINSKKFRTSSKAVMVLLSMVFVLAGTVTSYAAGTKVAEQADGEFKKTQEIAATADFTSTDIWSDEFVVTEADSAGVETIYNESEIMLLGGDSFYWTVPVGTRYVTSSIYLSKGTVISIACTARPSDCTYWFGLMKMSDNSATVVEGSGTGGHDFTISSSGFYRVMVENRSSQEITVSGGYNY